MSDQASPDDNSQMGVSLGSVSDVEAVLEDHQTKLRILAHRIQKLEARIGQESDNSVEQRLNNLEGQVEELATAIETLRQALIQ